MRIALISGDSNFGDALGLILKNSAAFTFIGMFYGWESAMKVFRKYLPGVVVVDTDNLGDSSGSYIRELKYLVSSIKIVIISSRREKDYVFSMFRNGADGYLFKNTGLSETLQELEKISIGSSPLSNEIIRWLVERNQLNLDTILTQREIQVLELMSSGKTSNEIATILFLSKHTVRTHISNIYSKLNVSRKSEVLSKARQNKIIL